MASNHTEHFSLNQWQADDQVKRTDFNEDNAKIDAALNDLSGGLAAAQAEKADQTALDALAAEVAKKATTAALEAVRAAVTKLVVGSYTGNGSCGQSHPRTLDFTATLGRPPKFVVVRSKDGDHRCLFLIPGMTNSNNHLSDSYIMDTKNTVTWSGNRVSWYADSDSGQMNRLDSNYVYFAIG